MYADGECPKFLMDLSASPDTYCRNSLKTWVAEESRFQTIASETVNGLTGHNSDTQSTKSKRESIDHRTFFINVQEKYPEQPYQLCKEQHTISDCHFLYGK